MVLTDIGIQQTMGLEITNITLEDFKPLTSRDQSYNHRLSQSGQLSPFEESHELVITGHTKLQSNSEQRNEDRFTKFTITGIFGSDALGFKELKNSFRQSSKIDLWKYFWRILFIFILLVGVIFAISKYTNGSPFIGNNSYGNNQFKILNQQFLSSKQKIILVKSLNKYLLLGVTDQTINLLTEYNEDEIDNLDLDNSVQQPFFSTFLGKFLKNGK